MRLRRPAGLPFPLHCRASLVARSLVPRSLPARLPIPPSLSSRRRAPLARSWQLRQGELAGPQRGQVPVQPGVPHGSRLRGEPLGGGITGRAGRQRRHRGHTDRARPAPGERFAPPGRHPPSTRCPSGDRRATGRRRQPDPGRQHDRRRDRVLGRGRTGTRAGHAGHDGAAIADPQQGRPLLRGQPGLGQLVRQQQPVDRRRAGELRPSQPDRDPVAGGLVVGGGGLADPGRRPGRPASWLSTGRSAATVAGR